MNLKRSLFSRRSFPIYFLGGKYHTPQIPPFLWLLLFVGGFGVDDSVLSLDVDTLKSAGITRVLSVMASNPHIKDENSTSWIGADISREFIRMQDLSTFQSHPWYQTTSAIIDSALHANERILIHWYLSVATQSNPTPLAMLYAVIILLSVIPFRHLPPVFLSFVRIYSWVFTFSVERGYRGLQRW
jgi:hypothetical protein